LCGKTIFLKGKTNNLIKNFVFLQGRHNDVIMMPLQAYLVIKIRIFVKLYLYLVRHYDVISWRHVMISRQYGALVSVYIWKNMSIFLILI